MNRRQSYLPFRVAFFGSIIFWLLVLSQCAHADTNLAGICKDATPPAETTCTKLIFDVPQPADVVKGAGGYFAQWSGFVGPTAVVYVCRDNIPRGSSACANPVTVTVDSLAAPPAGIIRLTWTHDGKGVDDQPTTLTGFWIYSGVTNGTLSKLKQITDTNVRTADLSGFGPGNYAFAVTATNADGESALSGILTHTVPPKAKISPKSPGTPTAINK